jgi:hypothetical protein
MSPREPKPFDGWIQLVLAVYLVVCGFLGLALMLDTWSEKLRLLSWLITPAEFGQQKAFVKTFLYTIEGSLIGAVIVSLKGLHEYGAVKGVFRMSFAGSYLVGPWASILLGAVVYALIRGGLLVFGGVTDIENASEATQFGYLGFGALIGFAWNKVLVKLNAVAEQIFSSATTPKAAETREPSNVDRSAESQAAAGQAQAE